jgi:hypothetical protein
MINVEKFNRMSEECREMRQGVRMKWFKAVLRKLLFTAVGVILFILSIEMGEIDSGIASWVWGPIGTIGFGMTVFCGYTLLALLFMYVVLMRRVNRKIIRSILLAGLMRRFGKYAEREVEEPILCNEIKGRQIRSGKSYCAVWENIDTPFRVYFQSEKNKPRDEEYLFDGFAVALPLKEGSASYIQYAANRYEAYEQILNNAYNAFRGVDVKISVDEMEGKEYLVAAYEENYLNKNPRLENIELWELRMEAFVRFVEVSIYALGKLENEMRRAIRK